MAQYRYEALDRDGLPVSGEIEAVDRDDAVDRLHAQDLRVVSLDAVLADAGEGPVELRARDFYDVTAHIADLASANLPLVPALRALEQELPRGRLQRSMSAIAAELEAGNDLSGVLKSKGAPADLVALVRAGGRAGRLGEFLTHFVVHYRKSKTLQRRTWLSLAYPLLLFVAGAMIVLFAAFWVVPSFKVIFEDFGVELPGITMLIVWFSDFLVNYLWLAAIIAAVLGVGLWVGARFLFGTAGWRRLWFSFPIVGTMLRSSTMAWFTNLLALLVENNIPLPEALLLAGDGTRDPLLRESCRKLVASSVARGEPFALVAHETPVFPAMFVQILSLENQRNALPGALRALAEIFERQTQLRGGVASVFLAPIVLCIFLVFVGFVVLALFMPLIQLMNQLS